jgi:formylglycine-generating enzyme required for sulfatase activity
MTEVIRSKPTNSEELAERKPPFENMVWIPGGTFRMGSEDFYLRASGP